MNGAELGSAMLIALAGPRNGFQVVVVKQAHGMPSESLAAPSRTVALRYMTTSALHALKNCAR